MTPYTWIVGTVAVLYLPLLYLVAALWWKPRVYPGVARWTAANVVFFMALLAMVAGDFAMQWLLAVANVLLIFWMVPALEGNREFRGLRPAVWPARVGGVVAAVAAVYFAGVSHIRAEITAGYQGIIAVFCAATLLKGIPPRHKLGSRFAGGMFALLATIQLGRATYFGTVLHREPGRLPEISAMLLLILFAACSIGWILLVDERRLAALEDAERIKRGYVRTIGHELRNPLSGIIATADLLLDEALPPEQRDSVVALRSAAEYLVRLTDDVLDFAKLEAGTLTIQTEDLDLRAMIAETASIFEPVARSKGVDLNVECAPGIPARLLGDGTRIRQIIVNLVSNALKFTSRGRVVIRASCEPGSGEKARVKFAVSDTGTGIPRELVARIFTQAPAFHSETGQGIGLIVSQKLIEQMGGTINVQSEPGKGSTFEFDLPLQLPRPDPESAGHSIKKKVEVPRRVAGQDT